MEDISLVVVGENDMTGDKPICNVCLSEKVTTQLDRLILCKDCTEKVREYYDKGEIKEL